MGRTLQGLAGQRIQARVTYYLVSGRTASGGTTHLQYKDARGQVQFHTAACSLWIPFGTIFRFANGFEVECQDRGSGINTEDWIDVWAPSRAWGDHNIARPFSPHSEVTIMRWGRAGHE